MCALGHHARAAVQRRSFTFDRVFSSTSSQEEVYASTARPLVAEALKGFNWYAVCTAKFSAVNQARRAARDTTPELTNCRVACCAVCSTVFAYGQTGSGKTHSMMGPHHNGSFAERKVLCPQP